MVNIIDPRAEAIEQELKKGNHQKALDAVEQILQLHPNDKTYLELESRVCTVIANAHSIEAQKAIKSGKSKDALRIIQEGLSYSPDNKPLNDLLKQVQKKGASGSSGKVKIIIWAATLLIIITGAAIVMLMPKTADYSQHDAWGRVQQYKNSSQPDSLMLAIDYYLEKYPEGGFASEAINLKSSLKKEMNAWKEASTPLTIEKVNSYLDSYGNGFYNAIAMDALDSLTFSIAKEKKDEASINNYISQFPNGRYAEEAMKILEELQIGNKLSADEEKDVSACLDRHFTALASNNKSAVAATMVFPARSYLGKTNAVQNDVFLFMDKVFQKRGATISFQLGEVRIIKLTEGGTIYNAHFALTETIKNSDGTIEKKRFTATAILNANQRITNLNIKEV